MKLEKDNLRIKSEVFLVIITGIGKIIFVNVLDLKFWFVLVAGLGWLFYLIWNIVKDKNLRRDWGFKSDGFGGSFRVLLLPSLIVVALAFVYGYFREHLILNWHILPVLVLYPIWGTIQQWLVICLFGNNLREQSKIPILMVYLLTASLFGIIHYPSFLLIVGTFTMSLVYLFTFTKYKNIYVLGLFHGWLGGIFYYFVLGRDAWLEFVKVL